MNVGLALLYLPMLVITWRAPEPRSSRAAPATLREAVWQPFVGFLARHRALEILAFVVLYKLADNLAQALHAALPRRHGLQRRSTAASRSPRSASRPASAARSSAASLTTILGLGHALWLFGFLQSFANIGYVAARRQPGEPAAHVRRHGFESLASGMGTGAFSVLLLRLTQKRFSATQYALFSSLFGLPRLVAGPICGFLVDAVGWRTFFWITIAAGIPGLLLLARFVPLGVREPVLDVDSSGDG